MNVIYIIKFLQDIKINIRYFQLELITLIMFITSYTKSTKISLFSVKNYLFQNYGFY